MSGLIGAVALAACGYGYSDADLACGSPTELANLAEQAQWERSIRENVFAALSAAHPDAEYERLSRQSDSISEQLNRMAEQYGDLDGGGWCDEDCQRRGAAFEQASAELRNQLTEVNRQRSNRRGELGILMQQQWHEEVSITASDASTLNADQAARSAVCEARLVIAVGSTTRFERVATYRSTENSMVEILSVGNSE